MSIFELSLGRRFACAAWIAVAAVCLFLSSQALAAHPRTGKTYSGKIRQSLDHGRFVNTYPISFSVTKDGKRVRGFTMASSFPIYCQGGGFGTGAGGSGSISKAGKFKVTVPIIFTPTHQHQGSLTITGTFRAHGRESGQIVTRFTKATQCGGTSPYTTIAH